MAEGNDKRRPDQAVGQAQGADERFNVPGAEILAEDTWADEPERCPNCGLAVGSDRARCPACGQWLARCGRSCPSCASPRCVGGERDKRR